MISCAERYFSFTCLCSSQNLQELLPACRAFTHHGPEKFCNGQSRLIKAAAHQSSFYSSEALPYITLQCTLAIHSLTRRRFGLY